MSFSNDQILELLRTHFGMEGAVTRLDGEIDLNFQISTENGRKYTLKIANAAEKTVNLELQGAIMDHLAASGLQLEVPVVVPGKNGRKIQQIDTAGGSRMMRLLTWVEGRCLADVNPHSTELIEQVGALCGKLSRALAGFDHPAAHRFIKWDPSEAAWTREHLDAIHDDRKRDLAKYFLQLFEKHAVPHLSSLRKSVNYNDANDYNILVSHDPVRPVVPGVIDFGDVAYTHTINELAIAAAYVIMHKPDPMAALSDLVRGYHRHFPMTEPEMDVLFPLIGARLLISVTCSAINLTAEPDNAYLQISDKAAWELMTKLRNIHPEMARAVVRHACGLEPFPKRQLFNDWIREQGHIFQPVVSESFADAVWLDLGVGSADLGNYADIEDADALHDRILRAMRGKPGIGQYDEVRPFYTTDAYAVDGNDGPEWRTVHIGLDIFLPPGTDVMAPLDGTVHSFQDNAHDRDYGPTIILEHRISPDLTFYTLYGHLSRTSLHGLENGRKIAAGEPFCTIGPMPENGNWSPHLHFQVILDMLGLEGDFPGVAFPSKRELWKSLCPDPWLFIGSRSPENPELPEKQDLLTYRREHLGKNLSLSYNTPLYMLRGWRQYLFDDTGRRYLDTVNNVAHVGHEHPRVVTAGQRQMAVLNTNTRYLHHAIRDFSRELLETFPPELNVVFLVNSGSEANELALRLARTYTGRRDLIAVEAGYHGNTQACIDISSYKFDGPGGGGAPDFVQIAPLPDTYRGLYRDADAGRQYAAGVSRAIAAINEKGRAPAAFICETVISCGGQIALPSGYLTTSAEAVRRAGGIYIADEVQTGCGRHGDHFWAFQEHGVVPDIVTIGKPIGNGHPLGAVVTTPKIAAAFANGMEYFNTFGGNPVSSAIGLEVLRVIREEGLQENARTTGAYLGDRLRALAARFPVIGDVRGPGLFLGFELVNDPETRSPAGEKASYLANRMRDLGILMSTDGPFHNVLKIKPPLVFNERDADFLTGTLERVLQEDGMKI